MAELSLPVLFLAAFGAATVLPFQSEVVFAAMQVADTAPLWALVAVASLGNTLGSAATCLMGRWIEHFRHRRWFPVRETQLERAQRWYRKWGLWTLLLTWAPFGDAIALAAGVLRTPWIVFLLLVAVAKTGRYVALALLTAGVSG